MIIDFEENDKLFEFCNRVIGYNNVLSNEKIKYFFLASLISSDALIDEEDYVKSKEILDFIKNNINLMNFKNDEEKEILKFVNNGLKIVKTEYQERFNKKL